jgi:catechol 2,3-dioxygenase
MGFKPKYLGHANLFVRDVERSEKFYTEVLGLHVNERRLGRAVFMSADVEQSHELAVIQLGPDAPTPEEGRVGLNHIAWRMETFDDLKDVYRRLQEKKANIQRIGDHGISLGVYFLDPDGNGNEVYYELPRNQWPAGDTLFTGHFPMSLEDEPASVKAN